MDKNKGERQIAATKFVPHTATDHQKTLNIKPKPIYIGAAILFIVSVLVFLFTAKAVYIQAEPEHSEISISSILMFKPGQRYLLFPGRHQLSVTAEGYYTLNETITVTTESTQEFTYTLKKRPGSLKVNTAVVKGAEVLIDGESQGKTPVLIRKLTPGNHEIHIISERYFDYKEKVDIEGLGKEQQLNVELIPAWAEISFNSTPANADIYVDDQLIGQTPFNAELIQGRRNVSVRLSGFKQWQQNINVIASQSQSFEQIELDPADAIIVLTSRPGGANVTVNGNYKGLTPLEFAVTAGKTTRLSLFKQGYKATERSLKLASGDKKSFTINLAAELVAVTFSIEPADAKLYVNGKRQAAANTTLQLPANRHKIEIRRDGFVDVERSISPHIGVAQQVRVRMKSRQQLKQESIKPLIKTFSGQTLKLFQAGEFTAGASRREPGRRANETMQKIKLTKKFYLGINEVTNAEYKMFKADHAAGLIQGHSLDIDSHPVSNVSWQDAAKYCNWLSTKDSLPLFYKEENGKIVGINPAADGYRLPTEAEWAWSARVQADNRMLKFPWGDAFPPTKNSGNFADSSASNIIGKIINDYTDGYPATSPAGRFEANDKGLYDMGGNVAEWVNDYYDVSTKQNSVALIDPLGPNSGELYVIRGSSWTHGTVSELRLSYRDYGNKARDDVGFRIARFAE